MAKTQRMTTKDGLANDVLAYCPKCERLHKATLAISKTGRQRYIGNRCGFPIKKQT